MKVQWSWKVLGLKQFGELHIQDLRKRKKLGDVAYVSDFHYPSLKLLHSDGLPAQALASL